MMAWVPLGKMVLVRLQKRGSALDLSGTDASYNGLGDVIGVGREVEQEIAVGDTVIVNGPQGLIAHAELGEDIALIPAPLVLARREEKES